MFFRWFNWFITLPAQEKETPILRYPRHIFPDWYDLQYSRYALIFLQSSSTSNVFKRWHVFLSQFAMPCRYSADLQDVRKILFSIYWSAVNNSTFSILECFTFPATSYLAPCALCAECGVLRPWGSHKFPEKKANKWPLNASIQHLNSLSI